MEFRNARFTAAGTIEVEINHPDLGWIPFHATPDDPEELGRVIFADLAPVASPHIPTPEA